MATKKQSASRRNKKVLLKLSGEAFLGDRQYGIDPKISDAIADQVKRVIKSGVKVAIVIGGGNIFRGYKAASKGMDRSTADYIGMLATVMNALALQNALEEKGIEARVQSAIDMPKIAEGYARRRAMRHMDAGKAVIFAAGTGNPYFSTDTAATLRALEMHCDILLKATKVDGVYDKDPKENKDAKLFKSITHEEVLRRKLHVMDITAVSLASENKLPIMVFNLLKKNSIIDAISGKKIGTLVS